MLRHFRYLSLIGLFVILSLTTLPGSHGQATAKLSDETEPSLDDTSLFVIGNTLFTLYHELGHALIDLLDLPVIGREEDAVDGFATLMMIADEPDPLRDELIIAVADGWRLQSDLSTRTSPFWGEHALDEQRHFAIVCLMVAATRKVSLILHWMQDYPKSASRLALMISRRWRVVGSAYSLPIVHRHLPMSVSQSMLPSIHR